MAKSLTIKNKNNLILYPKTVSSLVYNNSTGNTVKQDLDNLVGQVAELQGIDNAFFGGIVGASTDIATDYTNNGYSGTYLYMVGTDMTSLVAYQYTGSGSPTQLFSGTTYDFTDYSELKQELTALGPKIEDAASVHPETNEDGLHITDTELNTVVRYTQEGFDAAKLSSHFISLLNIPICETEESVFAIVDEQLNIGLLIDKNGVSAKNVFNFNIINN